MNVIFFHLQKSFTFIIILLLKIFYKKIFLINLILMFLLIKISSRGYKNKIL